MHASGRPKGADFGAFFGAIVIGGRTQIIAHLGYPTESFTAPMIYNPAKIPLPGHAN